MYVLRIFYYVRKTAHEAKITVKHRLGRTKGAIMFRPYCRMLIPYSRITKGVRTFKVGVRGFFFFFFLGKNVRRVTLLVTCPHIITSDGFNRQFMAILIFWDVMPYQQANSLRRFVGASCFHFHSSPNLTHSMYSTFFP